MTDTVVIAILKETKRRKCCFVVYIVVVTHNSKMLALSALTSLNVAMIVSGHCYVGFLDVAVILLLHSPS